MPRIVDPERVMRYSYASEGKSLLTPFFWNVFCRPVLHFLPRYASPNLISLSGNLFSTFAFLLLIGVFGDFKSLVMKQPLFFLIPAFSVLIYHVLDNIDGTQARRTHSSSPLGEFFDHWLDSFNSFMLPLGVLSVYSADGRLLVAVIFFACIAFWSSHREHKEEGKLVFPPISELEGILMVNLIYFVAAFTGWEFWVRPLPVIRISLTTIFAGIALVGYLSYPLDLIRKYPRAGRDLAGLLSVLIFPCLWFGIAVSQGRDMHTSGVMAGIIMGLIGAKKTGDLLGERLLGALYPTFDIPLLVLGLGTVVVSFFLPQAILLPAFGCIAVLLIFLSYQLIFLVRYVTRRLKIRVFSLTEEQKEAMRLDLKN